MRGNNNNLQKCVINNIEGEVLLVSFTDDFVILDKSRLAKLKLKVMGYSFIGC